MLRTYLNLNFSFRFRIFFKYAFSIDPFESVSFFVALVSPVNCTVIIREFLLFLTGLCYLGFIFLKHAMSNTWTAIIDKVSVTRYRV